MPKNGNVDSQEVVLFGNESITTFLADACDDDGVKNYIRRLLNILRIYCKMTGRSTYCPDTDYPLWSVSHILSQGTTVRFNEEAIKFLSENFDPHLDDDDNLYKFVEYITGNAGSAGNRQYWLNGVVSYYDEPVRELYHRFSVDFIAAFEGLYIYNTIPVTNNQGWVDSRIIGGSGQPKVLPDLGNWIYGSVHTPSKAYKQVFEFLDDGDDRDFFDFNSTEEDNRTPNSTYHINEKPDNYLDLYYCRTNPGESDLVYTNFPFCISTNLNAVMQMQHKLPKYTLTITEGESIVLDIMTGLTNTIYDSQGSDFYIQEAFGGEQIHGVAPMYQPSRSATNDTFYSLISNEDIPLPDLTVYVGNYNLVSLQNGVREGSTKFTLHIAGSPASNAKYPNKIVYQVTSDLADLLGISDYPILSYPSNLGQLPSFIDSNDKILPDGVSLKWDIRRYYDSKYFLSTHTVFTFPYDDYFDMVANTLKFNRDADPDSFHSEEGLVGDLIRRISLAFDVYAYRRTLDDVNTGTIDNSYPDTEFDVNLLGGLLTSRGITTKLTFAMTGRYSGYPIYSGDVYQNRFVERIPLSRLKTAERYDMYYEESDCIKDNTFKSEGTDESIPSDS